MLESRYPTKLRRRWFAAPGALVTVFAGALVASMTMVAAEGSPQPQPAGDADHEALFAEDRFPSATTCAPCHAELGLTVLVIELDDVLKRIRDYDRAKPIKPDFGAAKQMGFPKGGALIEKLYFFTDITGSDLCHAWKALYRRHDVPVQTGIELVGLEPGDAGVWRANVLNHRTGANGVICARHVVLALGAGTPRRLDVPGNVRAIADRLAGTDRYVGEPACVIGGGVSASSIGCVGSRALGVLQ